MAREVYRSKSVELPTLYPVEMSNPLHAPLQEIQETEVSQKENENTVTNNYSQSMNLFPLFQINSWFNHGWIYYFYFTGYSVVIKTVAVLLFSALIKEIVYLLLGDTANSTTEIALVFELILPYLYGNALIISLCVPIYKTYNYHRKQVEWSESQFSFMLKNLPTNMGQEELRAELTTSLNNLFKEKDIAGEVREIIFVQDCKEYVDMTTEIKSIKNHLKRLEIQNKLPDSKTLVRLSYCESKLAMLNDKAKNFNLFKGRAILILDSIWAKKLVKRVLRGRFCLLPSFKVSLKNRLITFAEIYEPCEMRFSYLNQRFWPKFILIAIIQLILLSGFYLSLLLRVNLIQTGPDTQDPWDNIQNMAQVTATVVYSSITLVIVIFLQNYIPYASKTTKYRFYIVYGVVYANLTISYVYESYLAQQGLEWTLSKVVYGMALFLLTNTGFRVLGYSYKVHTARRAVSEEEKQIDFDFWPSFNNIYQFLVLGIYYMALRPVVIFSLTIVLTIIILLIDKWFILKHTNVATRLQSFETGFNLYLVIPINLVLRYFSITYFIQLQLIQNHSLRYTNTIEDANFYADISTFLDYFSDSCLVFWAILMSLGGYMLLRDIFNQVNADNKVPYDTVSGFFKSFYSKEYPFYDLQSSQVSVSESIDEQSL